MTFFFFFNIQSLFSLTSNLPQNSFFHLYVVIQYLKLWESWNALHTFLRKCLSCLHITWKEEMRGTWRLFLKWCWALQNFSYDGFQHPGQESRCSGVLHKKPDQGTAAATPWTWESGRSFTALVQPPGLQDHQSSN